MKRPIIALLGAPGSGKGLVAGRLVDHYGFELLGMAAPAERMLAAGLGVRPEVFCSDERRVSLESYGGCTPAHLINTLRFEWGRRAVHSDVWADAWGRIMDTEAPARVVLKDACYPSEIRAVRSRGGVVWRIERVGQEPAREADRIQQDIPVDHTIRNNNLNPSQLYRLVDVGLAALEKRL